MRESDEIGSVGQESLGGGLAWTGIVRFGEYELWHLKLVAWMIGKTIASPENDDRPAQLGAYSAQG